MKKKKTFKKKLENFIKDESGNITKDKILKIGLGTISALGIMSSFNSAEAGHSSNAIADPIPNHNCTHGSHGSHSSY